MRNFGDPGSWHAKKRFQVVGDDHTRVYFVADIAGYF